MKINKNTKTNKTVTLADIAKATGYSINTVSHALHDKKDISETTKRYIADTAEKMGYIANLSASSLRSGRSNSIAVIVGDISNPHFAILIKEIETHLRNYHYTAIILNTDEDEELEHQAIVSAISKKVDGIILCPVQKSATNIKFLQKSGMPFTLLGRRFSEVKTNYVVCDDSNGGYLAAQHLLHNGCEHLLFFNAPSYVSSSRERYEGVVRALKESCLSERHLQVITIDSALSQIDRHLLSTQTLGDTAKTGIICFSDLIALQIRFLLEEFKSRSLQEIPVIGFDDIGSRFLFPMTPPSISSSKAKMSVESVDILMHAIAEPNTPVRQIILPTKLVMRTAHDKE